MPNTADLPQAVWQKKLREEYNLNPFTSSRDNLTYTNLDNPATWWHNPINKHSLRLTKHAYYMLDKTKAVSYKFKLTEKVKPKTFVQLERYFTAPYYILNAQTIAVFGEKESMMLALHANNLQQYLDNLDK